MWISWQALLFLVTVLIPDPGVSQYGALLRKECRACKGQEIWKESTKFHYEDSKEHQYWKCPPTDIVRFQLKDERRIICANKHDAWVQQLMDCIHNGKKCFEKTDSNSKTEFAKGTNEKPSTTTINAPTTAPVTSVKPSTPSWDHKTGQSTQPAELDAATPTASLVASSVSHTTPLDKAKINPHQGNNSSGSTAAISDGKMQHMRTTIISLIVIILVMVAVGLAVYCRRKKANVFNAPCGSEPLQYKPAPSEDSFIDVEAEK